ncbi:MAG: hypothetical protein AMJ53_01460 [Gammaproteobacteria bacterium SG8_11]|nr:MAG: hypothetical protein AMJ53_01460 [Gammaproteobacteria bacterium SG8_11]
MNKNSDKIRAFIGIKPSDAALAFIQTFKQANSDAPWVKQIRWTAEPNIHITMRFLGDLTADQINQIETGLGYLLENQTSFEVTITEPQPFPSAKKARILAALVHKNQTLLKMAEAIESLAVKAGVAPEERPFRGHITIGRFRKPAKGLQELLQNPATMHMPINNVVLFKSDLKPTGAEYTELASFHFNP